MPNFIRPAPLRLSRRADFNLQAASRALNGLPAFVVSRPGVAGNPFKVSPPGDETQRRDAVALFALAIDPATELDGALLAWRRRFLARLPTIGGHNCACWCPLPAPGQPDTCCHRSVVLMVANPCFDWPQPPRLAHAPTGLLTPPAPPGGTPGPTPFATPSIGGRHRAAGPTPDRGVKA